MSETVFVTLGGEQVNVTVEGGNIGPAASIILTDLTERAEEAAIAAEAAAATAAQAAAVTIFSPGGTNSLSQLVNDKLRRFSNPEDRTGANGYARLVNALATHPASGYGDLLFNDFIDASGDIIIPEGVTLKGPLTPAQLNSANYDGAKGMIRLPAGNTIRLKPGASIQGFGIIHAGRAVPYANNAAALADLATWDDGSIAITIEGEDCTVKDIMPLGFDLAIRSNGYGRLICDNVKGDCLNGIWVTDSYDVTRLNDCHFWPFLTAYVGPGGDQNVLFREGIAYRYSGTGDWLKATNCFSFGYGQGTNTQQADHITLLGCSFDNVNSLAKTDTIGIYVGAGSRSVSIIGCQTAAQGSSIVIDNAPDVDPFPSPVVEVIGHRSWATHLCHIQHNLGYLNVSGGTWELNSINEFRFADTILGATIDLDTPSLPAFVGTALALSKVRRFGSHIPDKTFNMVEAFPGVNITAETNAFKLIAQKLADDGRVLLVPEGAVVNINATIPINGVLPFTGGGQITLVGVNGPVFQYTISETIEHMDLGNVHFVNQATGGQPYDQSCALRFVSTDDEVFFSYNNLDDISGQGFHSLIRVEMATRTTSFGQESNFAWNRISRLTPTAGVNLAQYGVLMKAGSGTGNTFVDFTTALYDTTAVAAAVRVEGAGCVCGDIVFTGGHLGGDGAILSFGAGMAYRSNIAISASQPDAGLTKICHWDDPAETWYGLDISGSNIGGGVISTAWPYVSGAVIREVNVGRWEAERTVQIAGSGAKTVDLFRTVHAPLVAGQQASSIVEVEVFGEPIGGVASCGVVAKYTVVVGAAGVAVTAVSGPTQVGGAIITITPNVSAYQVTYTAAFTASGDSSVSSSIAIRGGTLKLSKP